MTKKQITAALAEVWRGLKIGRSMSVRVGPFRVDGFRMRNRPMPGGYEWSPRYSIWRDGERITYGTRDVIADRLYRELRT